MAKCKYCGATISLFKKNFGMYSGYCGQECMENYLKELDGKLTYITDNMNEDQFRHFKELVEKRK